MTPKRKNAPAALVVPALPATTGDARPRNKRERAMDLQERMRKFTEIYNAGWLVRDAYYGAEERQREAVMRFIAAMLQELRSTQDYEACLFAVADALYCSRHGVPWEP